MALVKMGIQKKTSGRKSTTVIQSPAVKRIHSQPVTLQGWLQKRGSDGLMLWKKRWFVLSDYCLFYYKDPEEEALLGSFVLASWIISPCTQKDKVYKKYSFKAEHSNMRTYYFAADNDVIMAQWLKALTMASLLQESSRPQSKINNSQMEQWRYSKDCPPQVATRGELHSNYNYRFQSGGSNLSPDNQPLYVNAPPKPKRLADGSSPDPGEEESRIMHGQNHALNDAASSSFYNKASAQAYRPTSAVFPHDAGRSHIINNELPRNNVIANSLRSPPSVDAASASTASHYECLRTSYTLSQHAAGRHPPRPRSVDFLEQDNKILPHKVMNPSGPKLITLPRRPKSSMSITTPREEGPDSTLWSEESYARKMRESSMYVQSDNDHSNGSVRTPTGQMDGGLLNSPSTEAHEYHGSATMQSSARKKYYQGCEAENQFQRSASARLPEQPKEATEMLSSSVRNTIDLSNCADPSGSHANQEQRDESMKRLLEWKQRMLHSPLTQKQNEDLPQYEVPKSRRAQWIQDKRKTSNVPGAQDQLDHSTHVDYSNSYETEPSIPMFNPYDYQDQSYARQRPEGAQRLIADDSTEARNSSIARPDYEATKPAYNNLFNLPCSPHLPYVENSNSNNSMLHYIGSSQNAYLGISDITASHNTLPHNERNQQHSKRIALSPIEMDREVSVSEPDEEWGLKLNETPVIKKFSYHYIKNDDNAASVSHEPNQYQSEPRIGPKHSQTLGASQTVPRHQSHGRVGQHEALKQVDNRASYQKGEPIGILKNVRSRKKLDLDTKTVDLSNLKGQWGSSYSTEKYDKRQVFSDTETLLYETSSDVDDKDRNPLMNDKFPNVSSDDDRDDEVASVLAKGRKIDTSSPCILRENITHDPARPSSQSLKGNDKASPLPSKNFSSSCENVGELPEENYMAMTPRKRTISASPLKDNDQHQVANSSVQDDFQALEECPYVEMNQTSENKRASLANSNNSRRAESNPASNYNRKQHYGSQVNDNLGQEPLYMEVNSVHNNSPQYKANQLGDKIDAGGDADDEDVRGDLVVGNTLPDILNTTAPSLLHHGSRRSDSSDADDEASKDLDSIDAPRHPRFSLSDTFRPASYYLGGSLGERAIIAMNSDHPDSSDSDLVSPPPIPACSPPLDDLDTSIDSTINNKELCLHNSKEDFHKEGKEDKFRYVLKSNLPKPSNQHDIGSSEEESVRSERTRHFMKRRPLSADILSSLSDFNPSNVSPSSKKDNIPNSELYDKVMNKNTYVNSRPASNPVLLQTVDDGEAYNPYRKNAFNMKNSYYDNRIGSVKALNNQAYNALGDLNSPMHNMERKLVDDFIRNDKFPPPTDEVNYDRSSYPVNLCPKDINYYANTTMLNMGHESQNNAPYYYSDLFKTDSKNSLNRLQKQDDRPVSGGSMRFFVNKDDRAESQCPEMPSYYRESGQGQETLPQAYQPDVGIPPYHNTGSVQEAASHYDQLRGGHPVAMYSEEVRLDHHRRSRSLEGLLDGKTQKKPYPLPLEHAEPPTMNNQASFNNSKLNNSTHAHDLSSSDGFNQSHIWKENARKVNMRQSRSLEELDVRIDEHHTSDRRIALNQAVYQNSEYSRRSAEVSEHGIAADKEREKIRQWDLMSSAPSTYSTGQDASVYKDSKVLQSNSNPAPNVGQSSCQLQQQLKTTNSTEDHQDGNWNLKFSAGDLLGRTHEELVLLLIQLRRQRAGVCKSMEKCHRDIEEHACLTDFDSINRLEHIQKLDELKSHLIALEKQYEKGKPLVNLVDNMVKLGSLYQRGPQSIPTEKLEFNHKVQEQRLLAEEQKDWERVRADHQDLQAKVKQLYRLDKLLQEESGTLHSLQEDKGALEKALGGLKFKLQGIHGNTAETEWYRRQQRLLERELSRVRTILALNSKKLEETVAENARLEQDLVVLRQKLQLSRRTAEPGGAVTMALESELCRVQLLVGNLLRQRQELSAQVRQLTEKSNSLSQQIWPSLTDHAASGGTISKKKHPNVGWIETDLDLGGPASPAAEEVCSAQDQNFSPLYVNTNNGDKQNFSNWREKPQEIKTVRIVKRESERRQRDRDHRSGNIGIPLTCTGGTRTIPEEVGVIPVNEAQINDCIESERLQKPPRGEHQPSEPPPTPGPRSDSVHAVWNIVRKNKLKVGVCGEIPSSDGIEPTDFVADSPQLSPVYLSETARKIVEEVAWQGRTEKRLISRERRRHHTVSGLSIVAPKQLYSQKGSRDDLDMERVLRPRLTTPDVVRSTLIRTDTNFTKETIDNILGAPGKIVIPERYIPESQPQLSKEEMLRRSKKADAIRKMLCETATVAPKEGEVTERVPSIKHQVEEEKKNREHLLQLNQILAQEVMEKSKIVAIKALASMPPVHSPIEEESDYEDLSPTSSLPLYQQRENFYS